MQEGVGFRVRLPVLRRLFLARSHNFPARPGNPFLPELPRWYRTSKMPLPLSQTDEESSGRTYGSCEKDLYQMDHPTPSYENPRVLLSWCKTNS